MLSVWDRSYETAHHAALRSKTMNERIRLVYRDIDRKRDGGRSYYHSMDTVLLAELLGVEDFEDSASKWKRFNAMERRDLDQLFEDLGLDGEEAAWFVDSIITRRFGWSGLPNPSNELAVKANADLRVRYRIFGLLKMNGKRCKAAFLGATLRYLGETKKIFIVTNLGI